MGWHDLSNEIKHEIIKWLPRDELKRIRLVCRALSDLATGTLFNLLRVHPSMSCMRRLQQIGLRPRLARCVQTLECQSLGLREDIIDRDDHFDQVMSFAELERPWPWSSVDFHQLSDLEVNRITARLHSSYLEEVAAQRELTELDIVSILSKTLAPFTHVHSLIWVNGDSLSPGEESDSDGIISISWDHPWCLSTGASQLDKKPFFGFLDVCMSLTRHPITTLTTDFFWTSMQGGRDGLFAFGSLLDSVRKLSLLVDICDTDPCDQPTLDEFTSMLQRARRLHDLKLAVSGPKSTGCINSTWSAILRSRFPNLERLTLKNVCATEDEVLEFLRAHRGTLTVLNFDGCNLFPAPGYTQDRSTTFQSSRTLKLLWKLRDTVNLSDLSLPNSIMDETWFIYSGIDASPERLLRRLEDYVCHRSQRIHFEAFNESSEEQFDQALSSRKTDP
ncbi:hypothetical protein H2200_003162 [Cladophialophora chaetospira]|uniref:F-box domain-containing protein n=1 Tax=Cladophialophora chaetospira TaxID=386627 RepID=A0AA39CM07_9EURO|nr:hypothetical protein H2200_003162 [Cladophialophora chaetospira]